MPEPVLEPEGDLTAPLTPPGAAAGSHSPDPLAGRLLDNRYRLQRVLGEGGMGKVYLAADLRLSSRPVAVKLMRSALTANAEFRRRFEREALLQANLRHPQIIQVLDVGESTDGMYIVMEYSEGRSLSSVLKALRPGSVDRALTIIEQILEVLDVAHRRNVVHRDLKPSNILVEDQSGRDVVKVLDFGIAKVLGENKAGDAFQTITQAGSTFGTLGYMAPEQAIGDTEHLDHRADIYSAGIILYELLTGHVPCPREVRTDLVQYAVWVNQHAITPIRDVYPSLGVPEDLDAIVMLALQREPDDRFQTAFDFLRSVQEFRRGEAVSAAVRPTARKDADARKTSVTRTVPTTAPARGPARAAAMVFAAAAAVLGWLFWQARTDARDLGVDLAGVEAALAETGRTTGTPPDRIRDLARAASSAGGPALAEARRGKEEAETLLGEARTAAATAAERIHRLEGDEAEARQRAERAGNERDEAQRKLGETRDALAAAGQEKSRLEGLLEAARTGQQELSGQKADAEKRLRDAEAEVSALTRERNELRAENQNLRAQPVSDERIRRLEDQVTGLKQDLQLRDQRLGERDQTILSLEAQLRGLRGAPPPQPSSPGVTFQIKNSLSTLVRIRVTAVTGSGSSPVTPASDTIPAGKSMTVALPAGTTRVDVDYEKWKYAARVYEPPQKRSADVGASGATLTLSE